MHPLGGVTDFLSAGGAITISFAHVQKQKHYWLLCTLCHAYPTVTYLEVHRFLYPRIIIVMKLIFLYPVYSCIVYIINIFLTIEKNYNTVCIVIILIIHIYIFIGIKSLSSILSENAESGIQFKRI